MGKVQKHYALLTVPLLVLLCISGCNSSPSLNENSYFFPIHEGTVITAGEEPGMLFSYEISQLTCSSTVYCLFARETPPDAEMPLVTCYTYFCSPDPFYVELDLTAEWASEKGGYEQSHCYSGAICIEVSGQKWYVSGFDVTHIIPPGTISGDLAVEAPYYSSNSEETFYHYMELYIY